MQGLGHQTVESTQRAGSQLGQSAHHLVEETTLITVSQPGPAIHNPRSRHDQTGDRAVVISVSVRCEEHMGMTARAIRSAVLLVTGKQATQPTGVVARQ